MNDLGRIAEIPVSGRPESYLRSVGRGAGDGFDRIWPTETFRWIPESEVADQLAAQVRALAGLAPEEPLLSLQPIFAAGCFEARRAELGAHRGGHEAVMLPVPGDGFTIRVDPRPPGDWASPEESLRGELSDQRFRFRAAHEIGHSFFYGRTSAGRRRRRASTPAEEAFCDRFAASLLLPPEAVRGLAATAASVIRLHERYAVSIELAARALAEEHAGSRVILGYWHVDSDATDQAALQVQWTNLERADALAVLRAGALSAPWSEARPKPPRRQLVAVAA